MLSKTNVLLRADGNSKIGLGHVHRLLALAEILKDDFECKFFIRTPLPGIRDLILKQCGEVFEVKEGNQESDAIFSFLTGKEIVVTDGYSFDTRYQQQIKNRSNILVCIDDIHRLHFVSDAVINPAGGVSEVVYSKETFTELFIGPKFSLLKKPFLNAAKDKKRTGRDNSILICFGGADPDNHTKLTLKNCIQFPFDVFYVVLGEAYLHKPDLEAEIKNVNRDIRILQSLPPETLADIMKQCAVAVCSASGIAYECLSVGCELYIKQTATNQADIYHYLLKEKLAFKFEEFRTRPADVLLAQQNQDKIFDGNSDKRILKIFNRFDFQLNASLRKVNASDLQTTFQWGNDPESRAQSFNSNPISIEQHTSWFNRKIADPFTVLYIFEYKNWPAGQVRFDVGTEAVISYSMDKAFRGRGWGLPMLKMAIEKFLEEHEAPIKIVGYVKNENISSKVIFENLGFTQGQSVEHPNSCKYELIKL